jgi:hypothetical protein
MRWNNLADQMVKSTACGVKQNIFAPTIWASFFHSRGFQTRRIVLNWWNFERNIDCRIQLKIQLVKMHDSSTSNWLLKQLHHFIQSQCRDPPQMMTRISAKNMIDSLWFFIPKLLNSTLSSNVRWPL